ncbi:MAG: hypothetical protein K6F76_02350 [Clostridiales bacterium]|nr:hypothetical protein [Clostridiales bacterium]
MKNKLHKILALILILAIVSLCQITSASADEAPETKIFIFLTKNMGFNKAAACGVLANIYYESAFSPVCYGDNGTSYGICQWHNGRFDSLKKFCKANGMDYKTIDAQLEYLKYELETSYTQVLSFMRYQIENTAVGAYNAGYYWCYNFEIPGNRAYYAVERGYAARYTFWQYYKNIDGTLIYDIFDDVYTLDIPENPQTGNNLLLLDGDTLPVLGDVDCDGKICMIDVTQLQKSFAKLIDIKDLGEMSKVNSDLNADNVIDLNDAVLIQRHIAGVKATDEMILILD